ncbi:Protein ALP1-like [Frankliniella fusca]|uniref:Protein ALP1-like n=1 Tax=Frankliniella fusca TaxID=407009 RepID=A0AAE1HG65_9NEOP|nr:Protein ALP1-like [Frankliniella fusca]
MWPEQFRLLVHLVEPHLVKRSIRTPLPTALRVALTLMFLAQGDSATSKHFEFRIRKSTVHKVVNETCKAIWDALQPIVLKSPSKENWKKISERYQERWQFPNCLGAIDGRHMKIQCPPCTGTEYYNYKGFFSIVLMAICDADHKFSWIDIGQYGSISDGGVWSNPEFAVDLEDGEVDLPDPTPLPHTIRPFPYVFVGDAAFPLTSYMMRPYPKKRLTDEQRVFNYRLSRARLTIENSFGILCARWQILHKPLRMKVENAENLFKALVCLHNFVMSGEEAMPVNERRYCGPELVDTIAEDGSITAGQWREHQSQHFINIGRVGANFAGAVARGMREYLKEYFNSDVGAEQAPWQFEYAFRGYVLNPPA